MVWRDIFKMSFMQRQDELYDESIRIKEEHARYKAALEALEKSVQGCYIAMKEGFWEGEDYEELVSHYQRSLDWLEGIAHNALHPEGTE